MSTNERGRVRLSVQMEFDTQRETVEGKRICKVSSYSATNAVSAALSSQSQRTI